MLFLAKSIQRSEGQVQGVLSTNVLFVAPVTHNLDIALVKLSQPVDIDDYVNVVCLPYKHENVKPGTKCVTAGWGHTEEGESTVKVTH